MEVSHHHIHKNSRSISFFFGIFSPNFPNLIVFKVTIPCVSCFDYHGQVTTIHSIMVHAFLSNGFSPISQFPDVAATSLLVTRSTYMAVGAHNGYVCAAPSLQRGGLVNWILTLCESRAVC